MIFPSMLFALEISVRTCTFLGLECITRKRKRKEVEVVGGWVVVPFKAFSALTLPSKPCETFSSNALKIATSLPRNCFCLVSQEKRERISLLHQLTIWEQDWTRCSLTFSYNYHELKHTKWTNAKILWIEVKVCRSVQQALRSHEHDEIHGVNW